MRTIVISLLDKKYITSFAENGSIKWQVTATFIVTHEEMVAWIEQRIHPEYRYG